MPSRTWHLPETQQLRDLADYDRAFGVVLDDGQVA
jgi:hypothetical protein